MKVSQTWEEVEKEMMKIVPNDEEPLCLIVGEKRKPPEPLPYEENKRPRAVGDIPMDLINEVMATIADPAAIPEVTANSRKAPVNNTSVVKLIKLLTG